MFFSYFIWTLFEFHRNLVALRGALLALTAVETKSKVRSRESNLGASREEEYISCCSVHTLACLIGDVEGAVDNDLALVVGIRVNERGALL